MGELSTINMVVIVLLFMAKTSKLSSTILVFVPKVYIIQLGRNFERQTVGNNIS